MLIANWKLDGDSSDLMGKYHGKPYNISFIKDAAGGVKSAFFNGADSFIEVNNGPELQFDNNDFTLAGWVRTTRCAHPAGDLFSKYDAQKQKGFSLTIGGLASGYSPASDSNLVKFGIDDAAVGPWVDCGKPFDSNTLITSLVVYKNHLYAGIADALSDEEACRIYRYEGGKQWTDVGRLGTDSLTRSAKTMVVHQGDLYAGTATYDWTAKSGPAHVYKYLGGKEWEDCGVVGHGTKVSCLGSWQGNLYAGLYAGDITGSGCCYKYTGDKTWEYCGRLHNGKAFSSFAIWRNRLYGASHGSIYMYEGGENWLNIGDHPFGITQIHKLQIYRGDLIVGTWPQGYVLRYLGNKTWENMGALGIEPVDSINEVNDLFVYNSKCYAGVIPKAEVYRYDSIYHWKNMGRLVHNKNWSKLTEDIATWARVPCFASYKNMLYAGTSTCHGRASTDPDINVGKVFSIELGKVVSYDDDIGADWIHIACVRNKDKLKLYINGKLVGETTGLQERSYDISNSLPLKIGFGEHNYFRGFARDLRIYNTGLNELEIKKIKTVDSELSTL